MDCSFSAINELAPESCWARAVLAGTVAVGECCSHLDPCVLGARCEEITDGVQRCVALASEGDVCEFQSDCRPGLVCLSELFGAGTCVPARGEGEVCVLNAPAPGSTFPDACASPFVCDYESGLCRTKQPPGAECDSYRECLSGHCVELECSPTEGCPRVCAPFRQDLPKLGEECTDLCGIDAMDDPHPCVEVDGKSICVARRQSEPGARCDYETYVGRRPGCSWYHGLRCNRDRGVCELEPGRGEPCSVECFCSAEGSACNPRLAQDEPCSQEDDSWTRVSEECQVGLSCIDGRCQPRTAYPTAEQECGG